MGLREDRIEEWARHYDILLWAVTAILLAADGALLVYCSERDKFRTSLAPGGMWLNLVTVVIAASMRELRHRVGSMMDREMRETLSSGRSLYQWCFFISIFVLIALGWILLLLENTHFWLENIHNRLESIHDCVCFMLAVFGVLFVIRIVWLGWRFRKPRAMSPPVWW